MIITHARLLILFMRKDNNYNYMRLVNKDHYHYSLLLFIAMNIVINYYEYHYIFFIIAITTLHIQLLLPLSPLKPSFSARASDNFQKQVAIFKKNRCPRCVIAMPTL